MLSKHFQRQVNELRVFCRHEDKGCGWQGELSDLERHVQSCPMRDQPQFHPEEYDQGEKSRSQVCVYVEDVMDMIIDVYRPCAV